MELTLDEVLQKAVEAHKAGQTQEADRLYTAILQAQPKHPDANHNMGVLAVGAGKIQESLLFFKTALEANPSIGQYWLSYIDALIQLDQIVDAQTVLDQAKGKGASGEAFEQMEQRLNELNETQAEADPHFDGQNQVRPNVLDSLKLDQAIRLAKKKAKEESPEDSKRIYNDVLARFPKNKRALDGIKSLSGGFIGKASKVKEPPQDQQQRLINLCQQGQLQQALDSAKQLLSQFPNSLTLYNIQGIANAALGQFDAAIDSYKQALKIKPDYADGYYNMGAALKNKGDLEAAMGSYKQALKIKPDYAEAHNNLGVTLQELGRLDEADTSVAQAIALKPGYAEAHNNLGVTLQELGRLDEAEASVTQAIALKPGYAEAHNNLGTMLQDLGRIDEAEASYRQAIALKPDYAEAHNSLLKCLYLLDKQSLFFDKLDYLINEDTANATIGSLTCRSALKYGVEKPNLFCREPLEYVLHTDMNTQYDFEEIFVEKARLILNENRISNRKQSLLVNGYQTSGNLFDIKNSFTEQIQKAIRLEVEKYRTNFKNSKDGLITKWPTEYSLYGWLIGMKSGGKLKPHIHSNGWLSGSLYINVPPKSKADSGNLVVSLGEEKDATDTRINVEKIINVVTGSLVLFPASLTHYTIPFEAEEERIVLAFDVKQK